MLGKNLRMLREKKGYTLKKVGEIVGYSENAVSQWERERSQPDQETLKKLAVLYDVSTSYLNGEEEKNLRQFATFVRDGEEISVYDELKNYDDNLSNAVIQEYLSFQKRMMEHCRHHNISFEYSRGRELLFFPLESQDEKVTGALLEVPEADFFERSEPMLFFSIGNEEDGYYSYENMDLSIQRFKDIAKNLTLSFTSANPIQ